VLVRIEALAMRWRLPQAHQLGNGLSVAGDEDLGLVREQSFRAWPSLSQIADRERLHE